MCIYPNSSGYSMQVRRFSQLLIAIAFLLLGACAGGGRDSANPVQAVPWQSGAIVAAANPHAVAAAIEILEQGGHAVEAAIAAHAVLGLVEPQSSGIGGGAFMLVYERESESLLFHDGRETAPAGATVDMFMRNGEVMNFIEAWQSGVAVGVPGTVALYEDTHQKYGQLPWATLFEPAIKLASEGFIVSPRMAGYLPRIASIGRLDENPGSAEYFFPQGQPLKPGDLLKNPEYADTLSRIAKEGSSGFYSGEIAEAMVAAAAAAPNPGTLSLEDIAAYRTAERAAICGPFRELQVCTTTPPSSGGAQIMMMGIYDHLSAGAQNQADKIAALVDAQRLAYADRDHFIGDPDAISIPLKEMLDPAYLEHRATQRFAPDAEPRHGDPIGFAGKRVGTLNWGSDTTVEFAGTTHLSIIDTLGNAVSMTATVEAPFGSGRWAAGFLLNNEMTDFARERVASEAPPANVIAPGRRPRSSMSPTMVFDKNGDILMVTGSPGGNSIPAYVFKSMVGVLDWGMSADEAVAFPNIIARGRDVRVEVGVEPGQAIAADLQQRGYSVQERKGENSGLHIIVNRNGRLEGAADPRREGTVATLGQE
jgi:gamma-glutamyltranspeptidase/glutathione hydrolase